MAGVTTGRTVDGATGCQGVGMFYNVIVGVDGRQGGRDAITLATKLASPAATITLAHFYGAGRPLSRRVEARSAARRRSHAMLERASDAVGIEARLLSLSSTSV